MGIPKVWQSNLPVCVRHNPFGVGDPILVIDNPIQVCNGVTAASQAV